jgi:hypothetical protein
VRLHMRWGAVIMASRTKNLRRNSRSGSHRNGGLAADALLQTPPPGPEGSWQCVRSCTIIVLPLRGGLFNYVFPGSLLDLTWAGLARLIALALPDAFL